MNLIVDGENMEEQVGMQYVVVAFDFDTQDHNVKFTVGGELDATDSLGFDSSMCREIPPSDWVVFSFPGSLTTEATSKAYTRILTEWFPASGYKRDEAVPHMERFPIGPGEKERTWEIWIPISKQ
jgi:AraC family transcriptional regulator